MEESGILNLDNDVHLFLLHHVFLPRINFSLSEFKALYNDHRLSTERNWTPNQIWHNGMLNPNNPLSFENGADEDIVSDHYGEDPSAPLPFSEENNINNITVEHEDFLSHYISNRLDVNRPSSEMGIDIYMEALELIKNAFDNLHL